MQMYRVYCILTYLCVSARTVYVSSANYRFSIQTHRVVRDTMAVAFLGMDSNPFSCIKKTYCTLVTVMYSYKRKHLGGYMKSQKLNLIDIS